MGRGALVVGIASKTVVQVLDETMSARGVSRASVEAAAGIKHNRMGRIFRMEAPITFDETCGICGALGITVTSVAREAEQRWSAGRWELSPPTPLTPRRAYGYGADVTDLGTKPYAASDHGHHPDNEEQGNE